MLLRAFTHYSIHHKLIELSLSDPSWIMAWFCPFRNGRVGRLPSSICILWTRIFPKDYTAVNHLSEVVIVLHHFLYYKLYSNVMFRFSHLYIKVFVPVFARWGFEWKSQSGSVLSFCPNVLEQRALYVYACLLAPLLVVFESCSGLSFGGGALEEGQQTLLSSEALLLTLYK